MKRSLAFWSALVVSALLVVGGLWLMGEPSASADLLRCLPRLDEEGGRLILQGRGGEMPTGLPPLFLEIPALAPSAAIVDSHLPLVRLAQEFLLAVEEEEPSHFLVLRLDEEALTALKGGRLPPHWQDRGFSLLDGARGSRFVLEGPWAKPLQGRFVSDLVLLADSARSMERFAGIVDGALEGDPLRWNLRPQWPAHLSLRLAGGGKPLELTAAWRCDDMPNELVWQFEGLPVLDSPRARSWGDVSFHLPRTPELVFGWRLSAEEGGFLQSRLRELWGFPAPSPERLALLKGLKGPAVTVFGAPASLLGLPVPGAFVEAFVEEGDGGVEAFWRRRLGPIGLVPKGLQGFARGGAVSVPLTVTAVTDEDHVLWGIVDGQNLPPQRPLVDFLPGLAGEERFWAVIDLPSLAETLQTPQALGRLLAHFGRLPLPMRLIETVNDLAPLGRLVVILPRLDSGWVTWTRPATVTE